MTTRRGFLAAMLAAAAAPAIIRSGVLMPVQKIIVPSTEIFTPTAFWGAQFEADWAVHGTFTASMYFKKPGGVWERMARTVTKEQAEKAIASGNLAFAQLVLGESVKAFTPATDREGPIFEGLGATRLIA